jgi:hypothetical protein
MLPPTSTAGKGEVLRRAGLVAEKLFHGVDELVARDRDP